MAEIKNSFLKSKMNRDLDDRLIPNGEYRDAMNISVGRSEADDVGALENIRGNSRLLGLGSRFGECIGQFFDDTGNRIFQFYTNYLDPQPNELTKAPDTSLCAITVVNFNGNISEQILVQGSFLNFSQGKNFLIHSVNLIENQLFWTDNRNQPRKINIDLAEADRFHYNQEWQISVAKFAPIYAPSLIHQTRLKVKSDVTDGTTVELNFSESTNKKESFSITDMTLIGGGIDSCDFVYIKSATTSAGEDYYTCELNKPVTLTADTDVRLLGSTMSNESEDPNWPGDPDYLESRYVRFSFRFKYEDDEYSAFAPFSQIAFIPQQKGYFIDGDEKDAFRSTIIRWFENNVNQVKLILRLPSRATSLEKKYKVSKIDLLYKESESTVVKVLDTVTVQEVASSSGDENYYEYIYQSQKPYRSLAESQTTRVYDRVPVRALAQEVSGNRVMYGNFFANWTPPSSINYRLTYQEKGDNFDNFVEYPNHTVKENRNYQVGVVLADKYNRQSSVILSSLDSSGDAQGLKGSTIFAPYTTEINKVDVKCYFGKAIRMLFQNQITSKRNIPVGTPGLYAEQISDGFAITASTLSNPQGGPYEYTFTINTTAGITNTIPQIGEYLRGKYCDYTVITSVSSLGSNEYKVRTEEPIADSYIFDYLNLPAGTEDIKFAYTRNPEGWYSYKIVVRQQEQDYYNAYLPGILRGYPLDQTDGQTVTYTVDDENTGTVVLPNIQHGVNTTDFPVGERGSTAHTVLINDNINKIPRDLSEVGPDQKQYRSSVEIYGRVENFESVCELSEETGYVGFAAQAIADYISYDKTDPNLPACIQRLRVGDGVEGVGTQGAGATGTTYPDDWIRSTVITEIDTDYAETLIDTVDQNYANVNAVDLDAPNGTLQTYFNEAGAGVISVLDLGTGLTPAQDQTTIVTVSNVTEVQGVMTVTFNTTVDMFSNRQYQFTYPQDEGRIYFKPKQLILAESGGSSSTGMSWKFFLEENRQYYPTRKADVVSTIADARNLGFLPTTLDNTRGTASLNLYNLETNPLIGRISTVNPIGVDGNTMVPFLAIYETQPVESSLEVFWETASSGLISDLNDDVLQGFDGIVGFSAINYTHYENQDRSGTSVVTGAEDSKWVTDAFFAVDNNGTQQSTISISSFSVTNGNGQEIGQKFELFEDYNAVAGQMRIAIADDNFVFNNDADVVENYTFTLDVSYEGSINPYAFSGRLRNVDPEIDPTCASYSVNTVATNPNPLVTLTGNNGSFVESNSDLYWEINPSNQPIEPSSGEPYFILENSENTAIISINPGLDEPPPQAVYNLTIRLIDAYNFVLNQPTGTLDAGDFDSKLDTCDQVGSNLDINVGAQPLPACLQTSGNGIEGGIDLFSDIALSGNGFRAGYSFDPFIEDPIGYYQDPTTGCIEAFRNYPNQSNGYPGSFVYGAVYTGRTDILNMGNIQPNPYTPPLLPPVGPGGVFDPTVGGWLYENADTDTGNTLASLGLPSVDANGNPTSTTNPSAKPSPFMLIHLDAIAGADPQATNICEPPARCCQNFTDAGCTQGVMRFKMMTMTNPMECYRYDVQCSGQPQPAYSQFGQGISGGRMRFHIFHRELSDQIPNPNEWQKVNHSNKDATLNYTTSSPFGAGQNGISASSWQRIQRVDGSFSAAYQAEASSAFSIDCTERPGEYYIIFTYYHAGGTYSGCGNGRAWVRFMDGNFTYPNGPEGAEPLARPAGAYYTGLTAIPGVSNEAKTIEFLGNGLTGEQSDPGGFGFKWENLGISATNGALYNDDVEDNWSSNLDSQSSLNIVLDDLRPLISAGQGIFTEESFSTTPTVSMSTAQENFTWDSTTNTLVVNYDPSLSVGRIPIAPCRVQYEGLSYNGVSACPTDTTTYSGNITSVDEDNNTMTINVQGGTNKPGIFAPGATCAPDQPDPVVFIMQDFRGNALPKTYVTSVTTQDTDTKTSLTIASDFSFANGEKLWFLTDQYPGGISNASSAMSESGTYPDPPGNLVVGNQYGSGLIYGNSAFPDVVSSFYTDINLTQPYVPDRPERYILVSGGEGTGVGYRGLYYSSTDSFQTFPFNNGLANSDAGSPVYNSQNYGPSNAPEDGAPFPTVGVAGQPPADPFRRYKGYGGYKMIIKLDQYGKIVPNEQGYRKIYLQGFGGVDDPETQTKAQPGRVNQLFTHYTVSS
tara:strand:+ start:9812 stop:16327 length:6516 start_codon:yes stop_codon:yes gene_type:complete